MKTFFTIFLSFCISITAISQTKVGDVTISNTFKTTTGGLVLNGAGMREKYWLDMYVSALYLKQKNSDAAKIIAADETMAIHLHIVSGMITSEKMTEAVDEGFTKSTNGNIAPLQVKINQFKGIFKEKIKEGDVYDLVYESGKGTLIYKNSKLITTIPGIDFKKALFGIWLCNQPADEDLKTAMLGK